jgi:hypothetical protein
MSDLLTNRNAFIGTQQQNFQGCYRLLRILRFFYVLLKAVYKKSHVMCTPTHTRLELTYTVDYAINVAIAGQRQKHIVQEL